MNALLLRTSVRYLLRHPWQFGLCVLGVALGVAVVVAIDLANASAGRAFDLSTERVTGRATHQIVGGPAGIDESLYRTLRVDLGLDAIAPVVEGYVRVPELGGRTVQLFGVDLFAEAPFRTYLAGAAPGGGQVDLRALLIEPGAVLLSAENAAQAGVRPGERLTLVVGSREEPARVVGLLTPDDDLSRRALDGLLIADIAGAQELLGQVGQLSRIDLILEDAATIAAVQALLPPGVSLERAEARSAALEQMTRAFELNLTALSLLALIVGMFLIYNTVTFSVVQRRGLLGALRCLGVTRGQVAALVLSEAVVISLIGSLLGLGLGVVLGRGLVGLVTQTINDLYYVVTVRALSIDPIVLLKGFGLGVTATLAAAAVPALEAMFTPPRTVLRRSSVEDRVRRVVPLAALAGALLIALGGVVLLIPAPVETQGAAPLLVAFGGLFAIVIGAALLAPLLTVGLMALLRPLMGRLFGLLGRMAARDVVASLSRTAVAVAALMVAVSVTIGVGLMVGSFRQTVVSWLEQSLVADVYVAAPSNLGNRTDTTIAPALVPEISTAAGVAAATTLRSVSVDTAYGPLTLVAIDGNRERGRSAIRFRQGGDAATWDSWEQGAIFISEPLAYRSGLGVGDQLTLRTDRGPQDFPIAGVYDDYSSDRGVIRMAGPVYRAAWDDYAISSLALYAAPGVDVDQLVDQLRAQVGDRATLVIGSNRALRTGTLEVFDRTFAITAVLQLLATIVAFIGILSALMALQLERARELALLRANGLTPRQLWALVISQTGLMGLTAGLLAAPLGLVLALVLIYVINRRSFGWTLDLNLDPRLFGQALLVALIAAVLAGIYPALRMSRTSPAIALREE
ncbi:MAG: ABC transporter permease [Oscillochloris sp.]|nr:ABC transporter permease [Oscillochloris sp.]